MQKTGLSRINHKMVARIEPNVATIQPIVGSWLSRLTSARIPAKTEMNTSAAKHHEHVHPMHRRNSTEEYLPLYKRGSINQFSVSGNQLHQGIGKGKPQRSRLG